jgi:hypothetical protein
MIRRIALFAVHRRVMESPHINQWIRVKGTITCPKPKGSADTIRIHNEMCSRFLEDFVYFDNADTLASFT